MPLCNCVDDISSADLADNIGLCDNADDLAMRIDDGRTANAFLRKQTGSFLRAGSWMDSMDMACHDVTCDHRAYPLQIY